VNMEALHVGGGRQRTSHSQSSTYSHAVLHAPAMAPAASSDSDGGPNMRGMDSTLGALCEHVQLEGWKSKAFSDIVVNVMGHTFHLHRLLLSRSSFFRSGSVMPMIYMNTLIMVLKRKQGGASLVDASCSANKSYGIG
jgi:hypothetical protein